MSESFKFHTDVNYIGPSVRWVKRIVGYFPISTFKLILEENVNGKNYEANEVTIFKNDDLHLQARLPDKKIIALLQYLSETNNGDINPFK